MHKSDRNIIQLYRSRAHAATFPAVAQVEGYWHGLCFGSPLPHRRDIDPRGMEQALAFAFVLERVAPGVCRFRIAGQHLNELMGLDVRGMPLTAMFTVQARRDISRIVETVCAEPCIKEVFIKGGKSIGRGELAGKIFLAPLLDEAGQVTRILGCLQTNGTIGRQPRRFAITEVYTKDLNAPRPRLPENHGLAEFAESPAPFGRVEKVAGPDKTNPPLLQLVVDNG